MKITTTIKFFVPGPPVGDPRARACAFRGKGGKTRARVYKPTTGPDEVWRNCIRLAALQYVPAVPMSGPVICHKTWFIARPEYMRAKKYPAGPIPHTVKPDRDNLDKISLDVMTRMGFWGDDRQVFGGQLFKWYCAKDPAAQHGKSGCFIEIQEVAL